ncbi:N-6 DNA methylase [Cellulomonas massiliensis]|uniref:N-6 DNA methylase n=1 Tax=Cellulomonas massiliensis TaxID=1465811 RepID=UPI0002F149D5|nr:N-6 DNA methylase [Cellulomonas massiliensis]
MNARAHEAILITKSDIAELAGVGRSTVSNWTSRHKDDFPAPVAGTATSPRYDEAAVVAWLNARGRTVDTFQIDRALWSSLDAWRGFGRPEAVSALAGSMVAWRFLSDPDSPGFDPGVAPGARWHAVAEEQDASLGPRLRAAMESYDERQPTEYRLFGSVTSGLYTTLFDELERRPDALRAFVVALSSIDANSLARAYEAFQDRLTTSVLRGYDDNATSETLVDLIASAAASVSGPAHDPCVGSGRLLLAVAERGEERQPLSGQEFATSVCMHARQRALLTGYSVTVRNEDAFESSSSADAAVVVLDPPFGLRSHDPQRLALDARLRFGMPPASNLDTGWLQLAIWHLREGGRAFVLQPTGSAYRGGREAEIRAEMVRARAVEAVVALPGGLAARTNIPLNLWVLARPGEAAHPSRVLLMDHSTDASLDIPAIAAALKDWRERRIKPAGARAVAVSFDELATEQFNLGPQRWLAVAQPAPTVDKIRQHLESLKSSLARLEELPVPPAADLDAPPAPPRMATIKDLGQLGVVTVIRPPARPIRDLLSASGTLVATSRWIRDGADSVRIDTDRLKGTPRITEPGDVVVELAHRIAARVDTEGGRVVAAPHTCLLRIMSADLDPHYVAAMLTSRANDSTIAGATVQRASVLGFRVPVVPIAQQRQIVETLAALDEVTNVTEDVLDAARSSRWALVEGVSAGTAAPAEA